MATWVKFDLQGKSPSGKTFCWFVTAIDGGFTVGLIKWYGKWRKYAFFPRENTVFEQVCLRDIADFCDAVTRDHRKRLNGRSHTEVRSVLDMDDRALHERPA